MRATIQKVFILCLPILLLSACGGGGGSSSGAISLEPFISWSSITPPAEVVIIDGVSQGAAYTAGTNGFTSIIDQGVSTSSEATIRYREDATIERIEIMTPTEEMVWDEGSGDIITETTEVIFASDPSDSDIAFIINPTEPNLNWDYQTFGVWVTGVDTDRGTVGAMSIGAPTTGSAIPLFGDATFTGITSGLYVDTTGTTSYFTASPLIMEADFFNRELILTTTDTLKTNVETDVTTAASNLDMEGTLSYARGSNFFTGAVETTDVVNTLAGTSTGKFYGPKAEELGGVFELTGEGLESYLGGYGAKQ